MNQWLAQVSIVLCIKIFGGKFLILYIVFEQFVIAYSFPYMVANITYGVFILFGTAVVLGAVFVWFLIPETSNISL